MTTAGHWKYPTKSSLQADSWIAVLCSKRPIWHTDSQVKPKQKQVTPRSHACEMLRCNCWQTGISGICKEECCTKEYLKISFAVLSNTCMDSSRWWCINSILRTTVLAKKISIYHLPSYLRKSTPCLSAAPVPFSCGYCTAVGSSCGRASRAWWKVVSFFFFFYSITAHLGLW